MKVPLPLSREENAQAEAVLAEYEDLVQRYAKRWLMPGMDLDDLVQVGRLSVLRAVERYNPDIGTQRGFVGCSVANAMKDHCRSTFATHRGRVWRASVPLDAPLTEQGQGYTLADVLAADVDESSCDGSELELLEAALAKLPARQQAAIRGRFWDQATFRELGEREGCRGSYIQILEARAMGGLRISPEIRKIKEGREV